MCAHLDAASARGFTGLILAGGASTRMGQDKAFVQIGGIALVERVANRLEDARAAEVIVIGGDLDGLRTAGLDARADRYPSQGPLGGLITGLAELKDPESFAFVCACDQPEVDPQLPALLLGRCSDRSDAAIPMARGVPQVLAAVYRARALGALQQSYDAGERSLRRAVQELDGVVVEGLPERWFVDLDTPEELARYAAYDE